MAARVDALTRTALECLLDPRPGEIVIAPPADIDASPAVEGLDVAEHVSVDQLPTRLRKARGRVRIVVTPQLSTSLARVIDQFPPALVIVTGELDNTALAAVPGDVSVLGPHARLLIGDGQYAAFADTTGELKGLRRTLPPLRLALSPVPVWLVSWLAAPELADLTIVGYVPATVLDTTWANWAKSAPSHHVIVPVGVESEAVTEPLDARLEALVAAHSLERFTGPVFPAPRVLALVADPDAATPASDDPVPAIWLQARRALPYAGSTVGMERPEPGLALDAPAAAFLAQRSRQRRQVRRELVDAASAPRESDDLDGRERALEVLRASGPALSEQESKVVLRGFGFEITRQALASSASGAAHYADLIGYPAVLKAVGPDLVDRGRQGLVELDLPNAAAVKRAYARIVSRVEEEHPTAALDGVLVSELAPAGLDLHCGAVRLSSGGVAIYGRAVGQVFPVEATYAVAPLSRADAMVLADGILSRVPAPALRRASDPQVSTVANVLERLSAVVDATDDRLLSVELGPVRLLDDERRYLTLDARITQRAHVEGL